MIKNTTHKFYAALVDRNNHDIILYKSKRACDSFYNAQCAMKRLQKRFPELRGVGDVITEVVYSPSMN